MNLEPIDDIPRTLQMSGGAWYVEPEHARVTQMIDAFGRTLVFTAAGLYTAASPASSQHRATPLRS